MAEPTIENRDFYEVMQQYRHMPISNPAATAGAYKNVIGHVNGRVSPLVEVANTAIEFYEFWSTQTKSDDERENFLRLANEAREAIRLSLIHI